MKLYVRDYVVVVDTDECATHNGGCEGSCTDNDGSYECSCQNGYQLSDDKHSCNGTCYFYLLYVENVCYGMQYL